ncbi:MAG: polysaccharide biosynthesis/export family protein [Ferruginibacter sp.]
MYKQYINLLLLVSIIICIASCTSTKETTYFFNANDTTILSRMEDTISPVIQKNDILSITITSLNAEASSIFNLTNNTNTSTVTSAGSSQTGSGYLVNSDGNIQLPILGNFLVAGSTRKEVKDLITATLLQKKLLIDPIVTIRHLNYEVTVIGEVGKPTVINVPSEKISLLKALGLAGDITIFGKKDNVLLIREISGKRKVKRVDLNSASFLTSPYYYLQPNDVVYVEANKTKVASSSSFRQLLPIILSGLSLILFALDRILR